MGGKLQGSSPLWHLAARGVLLCFFLCALTGCGSQEGAAPEKKTNDSLGSAPKSRMTEPGKSRDQQREALESELLSPAKQDKPVSAAKSPGGNSAEKAAPAGQPAPSAKFDIDQSEVVPPMIPGQRGPTQAQIKALMESYSSKLTPESFEVIPPPELGQPGTTLAEINTLNKSREGLEIEADFLEIAPPGDSGRPAATRAEVEAVLGLEGDMKSGSFEVSPPEIPGGNGITQAEVAALGTLQPQGNRGFLPVSKNPAGK